MKDLGRNGDSDQMWSDKEGRIGVGTGKEQFTIVEQFAQHTECCCAFHWEEILKGRK